MSAVALIGLQGKPFSYEAYDIEDPSDVFVVLGTKRERLSLIIMNDGTKHLVKATRAQLRKKGFAV